MYSEITKELKKLKDYKKAEKSKLFFKTGAEEYGEGDKFLGIAVPQQKKIAKLFPNTSLTDLKKLLNSQIHEYRSFALIILVNQFKKAGKEERKKFFDFYLKNISQINNWDLVDSSAPYIVGEYLKDKEKNILYKLSSSPGLWRRRIAIMATFNFIRENNFKDTLKIAEKYLKDKEDLIHKATGWMLREVGKRDLKTEEKFLKKYYKQMPRTMLRYAIEKFPENKRKKFLKK